MAKRRSDKAREDGKVTEVPDDNAEALPVPEWPEAVNDQACGFCGMEGGAHEETCAVVRPAKTP